MSAEPGTPHRLTPTEQRQLADARLHEVTLAFAARAAAPPEHTVEMSRNAKGIAQFTVTVRGYDLDDVIGEALAHFAGLEAAHPYPTNGSE